MQETGLQMEESVLLPDEHGQYWVRVSNPTPDPGKISPEAMVGKLEMVAESKANTTLLELKSDPDRENPPLEDKESQNVFVRKVSALGGEAIEERQQKLVTLLKIENSSLTSEGAQQILDCVTV